MIDPFTAAAIGSAAVGGLSSFFGSKAAAKGADQQAEIARRRAALQRQATDRQLADLAPYKATGYGALNDLGTIYGQSASRTPNPYAKFGDDPYAGVPGGPGVAPADDLAARRRDLEARFQDSPEYRLNYRNYVDEASRGIERNASASGLLNSGRTLEALGERAGRIGNQLFGDYTTKLFKLAGAGQEAVNSGGAAVRHGAEAEGSALDAEAGAVGARADARMAGILGVGQAVQGGLSSYANQLGRKNALSAYGRRPWRNPDTGAWQ